MASSVPSIAEIQRKTSELLGVRPCYWQAQVAQALLRGDKDILSIAGTGSGKTLTFWIPLLFCPGGIQIVATPLNILGKQNEAQLAKVGIRAIALRGDNSTHDNWKAIEDGVHRAVIISPEEMFKKGGGFSGLAKKDEFTARIVGVIWDEGHCLGASSWGTFRSVYKDTGRLRHILPKHIPYYVTSATLDDKSMAEVKLTLQMHSEKLLEFHRSNDRPNIHITVRKITRSLKSFHDLDFLIPKAGKSCPKMLVFFDTIAESIAAAKALKARLPPGFRIGIKWFNSDMSGQYRDSTQSEYKEGGLWALFCTDSFGMGVDLPDIELVVQWRVTCDMRTLWQRFGHAARDPARVGKVLLLAEGKWFDDERAKKKAAQEKRAATAAKRKAKKQSTEGVARAAKRSAVVQQGTNDGMNVSDGPSIVVVSRVAEGVTAEQGESASEASEGEGDIEGDVRRTAVPTPDAALIAAPSRETTRQEQFDRLREIYVDSRESEERATRTQKKGSKKPQELSPELDNLVNAKSQPHHCYRVPILAFFASDKIVPDHKLCRPDLPGGCQRCCVMTPTICCELCNPAAFASFAKLPELPVADRTSLPGRSRRIDVKYSPMEKEKDLRLALHKFRRQRTIQQFSKAVLQDMGPGVFMSNAVLQRIVDCGRVHKIETVEQLERETQWKRSKADHDEVLRLVTLYFPPVEAAPLVRAPLAPRADQGVRDGDGAASRSGDANPAAPTTTTTRPPKKYKCGKCHVEGHIASNRRLCPFHPKYEPFPASTTPADENTPPINASDIDVRMASPEPPALVEPLPAPQCSDVVQPESSDSTQEREARASMHASGDNLAAAGPPSAPRPRPRPRPILPASHAPDDSSAATPESSDPPRPHNASGLMPASHEAIAAEASSAPRPRPHPRIIPPTSRAVYDEPATGPESSDLPGPYGSFAMKWALHEEHASEGPSMTVRVGAVMPPPLTANFCTSYDERAITHESSDLPPARNACTSTQSPHNEPPIAGPSSSARTGAITPTRASHDELPTAPNSSIPPRTAIALALTHASKNEPAATGPSRAPCPITAAATPPPLSPARASYDEPDGTGPSCVARAGLTASTATPAPQGSHSPFGAGTPYAYHAYSTVHHTSLTSSFPYLLYEGGPSARFVGPCSPWRGPSIPTSRFYGLVSQREQDDCDEDDAV